MGKSRESLKKCLVTGVAGFIGSHLARRLLEDGIEVRGIDCFTDYYPRSQKEANLGDLLKRPGFSFVEADLVNYPLDGILDGVDWVFHQAAQAGVRASWGTHFRTYTDNNILATQLLLEACLRTKPSKLIYASSSSVYGDVKTLPVAEDAVPAPISPYGVTKLAAEHLCLLYGKNFGLPVVSLRYFTVYGPGQRPDMAFHKFLRAIHDDRSLTLYGDGRQTRDFTYVADAVAANVLAARRGAEGAIYNIGGGHNVPMTDVIRIMEKVTGKTARIAFAEPQKGDVRHTHSNSDKARKELGFDPRHSLEDGIRAQYHWLRDAIIPHGR